MKRTIRFYNPSEIAKAKKELKQLKKENPKTKYIIEKHPKWGTLDIKTVKKTKIKSIPSVSSNPIQKALKQMEMDWSL